MKKYLMYILWIILVILTIGIVYTLLYKDQNSQIYQNELGAYSVTYPRGGVIAESKATEFSFLGTDFKKITFFTVNKEGARSALIGSISCATVEESETTHSPVPMRSANLLYNNLIHEGVISFISPTLYALRHNADDKTYMNTYQFTVAQVRRDIDMSAGYDVNTYFITDLHQGKYCVISYPEYDLETIKDGDILSIRKSWLHSFTWIN